MRDPRVTRVAAASPERDLEGVPVYWDAEAMNEFQRRDAVTILPLPPLPIG